MYPRRAGSGSKGSLVAGQWRRQRVVEPFGISHQALAHLVAGVGMSIRPLPIALSGISGLRGPDPSATCARVSSAGVIPDCALSLGMAVHELATNAAKYGALSGARGTVAIKWSIEPAAENGRNLALEWRETGGPKVVEPEKPGFGVRLIQGERGYHLGGKAEMRFGPDGLVAQISLPLARAVAGD